MVNLFPQSGALCCVLSDLLPGLVNSHVYLLDSQTGEVVFWGGSSYFSDNTFYQHEWQGWALKIWATTTTLLMWPWPMRMVNRVKLTRWSWLEGPLLFYLAVIITSAVGKRLQVSRCSATTCSTCVLAKHNKKVLSSVRPNVVDFVREDCNCLPALLPALCLTLFDPRHNIQGAATPSTWSTRMPRVPSSASIYMGPEEGEHP